MAWGSLQTVGWVTGWSNGYYAVDNYVYYQINLETRQLRVQLANQRCRSLNSYYGLTATACNNGYQLYGGSSDTVSGYSKVVDVVDSVTVPKGGEWVHSGDRNCAAIYTYNDDGSSPTISMATQFICGINSNNTPEFDWTTSFIQGNFPGIAKKTTVGNIKVNVNGTAKSASALYVNVNGTAKKVTSAYVNVNGNSMKIF